MPQYRPEGTPDILSMDIAQLEDLLVTMGQPRFRGRQLFEGLWAQGISDYDALSVWPRALRAQMQQTAPFTRLIPTRVQVARDGSTKSLLRLADNEQVETVLLPHPYGYSVCVSSQVGCNMGCRFCASGLLGKRRNLSAGEIMDQVAHARKVLQDRRHSVRRVDLMGIGEPLDNYQAVVQFMRMVHEPAGVGLSWRHITVSTSGVVPAIRRLAEERLPVTLAISLHAPTDAVRTRLMPINRAYPLAPLMEAARAYAHDTGRRVTFEYAMLQGINDDLAMAETLCQWLYGFSCHVNLIPWNPVPEHPFQPSSRERVRAFRDVVQRHGISCTIRKELGQEIDAACGQLRHREEELLSP